MKDLVRISACVPRLRLADPLGNGEEHLRMLTRAAEAGATLVLFP